VNSKRNSSPTTIKVKSPQMTMSHLSLNNPPLICLVARIQFAQVAKIASFIPDLNEALRKGGYPHFQKQNTKKWQIQDSTDKGMNVSCSDIPRWCFGNLDKTIIIRVDQESVTLLFTDYVHFENAEPHFRDILEIIEHTIPALQPLIVQLRYISYIPVEESSDPTDWVKPSVLGTPNLEGLTRLGSISETNFLSSDGGQLVARCISRVANDLTLPPDLLPLDAKLKYPLKSIVPFLLLENLHQRKADPVAFSAESCLKQLSALRKQNTEVFRAIGTPKALESWK
jgi:uncharacterized protein (TIGR04255 family)